MNTNVQINTPPVASDIARVAFSMFVYIADVDKSVTAQDVRRFQALLRETAWVDSEDLRQGLQMLQQNYSAFWANYEDGAFLVDAASIAESLDRANHDLGNDRAVKLRRSLHRFLDRLDSGAIGAKLIQGSDQRPRLQARKELLAILDRLEEKVPHASPRRDSSVTHAAAKAHPSPLSRSLSVAELKTPEATIRPLWPTAGISPDQMPVWSGGRMKVRCVSVVWETEDTKTYSFAADQPTLFHYKPGQFVTIEVPLPGSVLRRSYTISSSPSRPYTLSITVKKVPMGWMSNWLFDNMVESFECAINGPAGKFTCHDYPSSKLLFLAAGSGITPSMSMLRWLADTSSNTDIVFINNVRTPEDIIFHQELLHMSTRMSSRIRLAIMPAAVSPARPWHGPIGRLDEMVVRSYAPDFAERETFVCGPPGYMAAAKALLADMGLPMEQYHDESFGTAAPQPSHLQSIATEHTAEASPHRRPPPTALSNVTSVATAGVALPAPPATIALPAAPSALQLAPPPYPPKQVFSTVSARDANLNKAVSVASSTPPSPAQSLRTPAIQAAPVVFVATRPPPANVVLSTPSLNGSETTKGVCISLQASGDSFAARPGQTILDAAESAGVMLSHSCRAGICGSCKMRAVSGRIEMGDQNSLSQAEIDSGYVLTCVGKPLGDVVLAP